MGFCFIATSTLRVSEVSPGRTKISKYKSYMQEEAEIFIPIKALDYVKDSCLNILNILEDSIPNGKNIKDEVLKKYIDLEINKKVRK